MSLFTLDVPDFTSHEYARARLHYLIQIVFGESLAINYCKTIAEFAPTEEAKTFLLKQQAEEEKHLEMLTDAMEQMERPYAPISPNMKKLHMLMEDALTQKDYALSIFVQNFIVEGLVITLLEEMQKHCDPLLADVAKKIIADEVSHVQFGITELAKILKQKDHQVYDDLIATQRKALFYAILLFADVARDTSKLGIAWDKLAEKTISTHVQRISEAGFTLPLFDRVFLNTAVSTMRIL